MPEGGQTHGCRTEIANLSSYGWPTTLELTLTARTRVGIVADAEGDQDTVVSGA